MYISSPALFRNLPMPQRPTGLPARREEIIVALAEGIYLSAVKGANPSVWNKDGKKKFKWAYRGAKGKVIASLATLGVSRDLAEKLAAEALNACLGQPWRNLRAATMAVDLALADLATPR